MEDDRPRDRPGLAQLCSTLGAAGREGGPRRRMGREGIWGKIVNVPGRDFPSSLLLFHVPHSVKERTFSAAQR